MITANIIATNPIPSLPIGQPSNDAVAMKQMNSTNIATPNQKKPILSMPSRSSKLETWPSAVARSSSVFSGSMPKTFPPITIVAAVATTTYGAALMKNVTNPIPAVVPTIMFGTEEISVSNPPMFVSNPSTSKKPSNLSRWPSLPNDTALKEPTMIIAVTLLSTALNTTVITP